ncbi:YecA family protein [Alteromonas sediminis]|uniref:YecA family protein n=1 Tax=Alteromonas sediminis TaxID=2259342 RepID=A0A3N5Z9B4_9ALTE|nr:UPF0149 family protein [Alteromonas sediminis]RPJ65778.1 YecA family protein [Alteromonas sediminis]
MLSPELTVFIHQAENKRTLMPGSFVAGLVFGVSASPEIPMPEKWMPWTLSSAASSLDSHQADALADALMGQLRWQLDTMRNNQIRLPVECKWDADKTKRTTLENWLSGLMFAHQQCEPEWQVAWNNRQIDDAVSRLTRCIKCFSLLADADAALKASPDDKKDQLIENLPVLTSQLTSLLQDYVALAGELAGTLPGQFELTSEPANKLR